MLFLRDHVGLLAPPPSGDAPDGEEHDRLRAVLAARGACFFRELAGADDRATVDALWDLVWAGEVTNDSFAPVRGPVARWCRPPGGDPVAHLPAGDRAGRGR